MFSARHLLVFIIAIQVLSNGAGDLNAQAKKRSRKVEIPAPERVLIMTKDQVELRAEWFAGTNGKESVPMILVHDWNSNRSELTGLAKNLQKREGYAVIVPDLRGHGESMTVKGSDKELDRKRFKKMEMASIVEDIDACRRFLQKKNDQGELNLDLLSVVACGKMGIHAVNWCVSDWSWEPINGVKQGQNVKSLALISPSRRYKSISMSQALKAPLFSSRSNALPILLFWGENDTASNKESDAIFKSLKKSRKEPEKFDWESQTLFDSPYPSADEGPELFSEFGKDIADKIIQVIEKKVLVHKDDYPWQSREVIKN